VIVRDIFFIVLATAFAYAIGGIFLALPVIIVWGVISSTRI
jgi:hypothetical protein